MHEWENNFIHLFTLPIQVIFEFIAVDKRKKKNEEKMNKSIE